MSRQTDSNLHQGLSSLIGDDEPRDHDGGAHNPLAGARPARRRRRWLRRLLLLVLYAGIVGVIIFQGSRFWQNHPVISGFLTDFLVQNDDARQDTAPPPVSEAVQTEQFVRVQPSEAPEPAPAPLEPPAAERPAEPESASEPATIASLPVAPETETQSGTIGSGTAPTGSNSAQQTTDHKADPSPGPSPAKDAGNADSRSGPAEETDALDETTELATAQPIDPAPRETDQRVVEAATEADSTEAATSVGGDDSAQPEPVAEPEPEPETGTSPDSESRAERNPETREVLFSESGRNQRMEEARNWFREGHQQRALNHLAEWLRADDHTEVRQLYGRLALRAGRPQDARRVVRPQASTAEMELRAYADYQTGAYADAVRYYTRLLNEAPTIQAEWYLWLGIGSEQLQNPEEARRFYRLYLREGQQQSTQLRAYAQDRLRQLDG